MGNLGMSDSMGSTDNKGNHIRIHIRNHTVGTESGTVLGTESGTV